VKVIWEQSQTETEPSAPGGKIILALLMAAGLLIAALVGLINPNLQAALQTDCPLSSAYPVEVRQWCHLIRDHAARNGFEPELIAAIILKESSGNPNAASTSGAVGLMQVMPNDGRAASFECNGKPCFADRPSSMSLSDPDYNIRYGVELLRRLTDYYGGNLREALRAYGPIDVGYDYADLILKTARRLSQPPPRSLN
jgi:soluble lytic murein transglycosylase-like protein